MPISDTMVAGVRRRRGGASWERRNDARDATAIAAVPVSGAQQSEACRDPRRRPHLRREGPAGSHRPLAAMAIAQDRRGLTKYLWGLAVVASAQTSHAQVIFRDSFSIVNASCGDTSCSDCIPSCKSCPWDLSLTGTPCNHSTRTIAPCPAGRSGSCVLFNVTYCGGSGASSGACYRSEFSGTAGQREGFQYGTDYWFGFSLRLPDAYTLGKINPQEEIHFQMHGSPNRQLHEAWRNPIFALSVLPNKDYDRNGKQLPYSGKSSWEVTARGDPRLNITQRIKPDGHGSWDYKWENTTTIGDAVGGQWENFVYHTR